jgi:hypothetical protein
MTRPGRSDFKKRPETIRSRRKWKRASRRERVYAAIGCTVSMSPRSKAIGMQNASRWKRGFVPNFDMGDYKEVSERLRDLFAKHPEASLRGTYEFVDGHVIYRAECYRTPDDPAPAVGTAWEEVPGRTPYTKGSELQNAETSAWGRAIVAAGASESKRIASADEMRLANDRRTAPKPQRSPSGVESARDAANAGVVSSSPAPSKARRDKLKSRCVALQADGVSIADEREALDLPLVDSCNELQLEAFEELVTELEARLEAPFEAAS